MFKKSVASAVVLAVLGVACNSSQSTETKSPGAGTATATSGQSTATQGQAPVNGALVDQVSNLTPAVVSPVEVSEDGTLVMRIAPTLQESTGQIVFGDSVERVSPSVLGPALEGKEVALPGITMPVTIDGRVVEVKAIPRAIHNAKLCEWTIVWVFEQVVTGKSKRVEVVKLPNLHEHRIIVVYTLELKKSLKVVPTKVKVCTVPGIDNQHPDTQFPGKGKDDQFPGKDKDNQFPTIDLQYPKKPIYIDNQGPIFSPYQIPKFNG